MGHDITAIRDYDKHNLFWRNTDGDSKKIDKFRKKSEIAYLRRSAWSETIEEFYKALYCGKQYNGCSGDGNFIMVDLDALKESIEKIRNSVFNEDDQTEYLEFIDICINYCKENKKEGILIQFG